MPVAVMVIVELPDSAGGIALSWGAKARIPNTSKTEGPIDFALIFIFLLNVSLSFVVCLLVRCGKDENEIYS